MKIAVYLNQSSHQQQWAGAFVEGLARHGIVPTVVEGGRGRADREPVPADLAVFWGHRRRKIIEAQKAAGADYLVLEHGFMGDRREWTSAGFNGLNGRADFRLHARQDRVRFDTNFSDLMQPWRTGGAYALLLGQVPGDMSIRGLDIDKWYSEQIAKMQKCSDLPIKFRPHPKAAHAPLPAGLDVIGGTLADAFAGAAFAVTFNSNSGVEAALAGVPVYALDAGSMARPIAAESLCLAPWRPDRLQWAVDLAWCQWTEREIRAGMTWDYLKHP